MRFAPGRTGLACIAAAGLLACAGGEEGGEAAMSDMAGMGQEADTVMLAPKNESGISGHVTLTEAGDSITLAVMLEGGTPGTTYANHIHTGDCTAPGGVAAPLTGVTVTEDSTGTATTTVAASAAEGLVQVHLPGGQPAACGEIN